MDSKLRGCDFVTGGSIRNSATALQQETGKPVQFELMGNARKSLYSHLKHCGGFVIEFVFPGHVEHLATFGVEDAHPLSERTNIRRQNGPVFL